MPAGECSRCGDHPLQKKQQNPRYPGTGDSVTTLEEYPADIKDSAAKQDSRRHSPGFTTPVTSPLQLLEVSVQRGSRVTCLCAIVNMVAITIVNTSIPSSVGLLLRWHYVIRLLGTLLAWLPASNSIHRALRKLVAVSPCDSAKKVGLGELYYRRQPAHPSFFPVCK